MSKKEILIDCLNIITCLAEPLTLNCDLQTALGLPLTDKYGDRYFPPMWEWQVAATRWLANNLQLTPNEKL